MDPSDERYIYRSMNGGKNPWVNVGKYTVRPMDLMGGTF